MGRKNPGLTHTAKKVLNRITVGQDQLNCQRFKRLMAMLEDKDTVWRLLEQHSKAEIVQASLAAIYAPKEVKQYARSSAE